MGPKEKWNTLGPKEKWNTLQNRLLKQPKVDL